MKKKCLLGMDEKTTTATTMDLIELPESEIQQMHIHISIFPVAAFASKLGIYANPLLVQRKFDCLSKAEIQEDLCVIRESAEAARAGRELVEAEQTMHNLMMNCVNDKEKQKFYALSTKLRNYLRQKYIDDEKYYNALIIQGKLALGLLGTRNIHF
jgi:hypothetical protein